MDERHDIRIGRRSRSSPEDPYCEFRSDRERRNALISRDIRFVLCRLATVAGVVGVVMLAPGGLALQPVLSRLLQLL